MRVAMLVSMLLACLFAGPIAAQEGDENTGTCFALADESVCIREESYRADVCSAIAIYADHWSLPEGFLARLIWQESRFDPAALSPAGAEGIAQFIPSTARLKNLRNPFDPAEALARSAEYLRFLELKFGNLGLAAAAYNGGEGRVGRYVAGNGGLPSETRNYVVVITGITADQWLLEPPEAVDYSLGDETDFHAACLDMARSVQVPDLTTPPAEWQPWGILISQTASAQVARTSFDRAQSTFTDVLGAEKLMLITVRNPHFGNRLRFSAMVGRQSREEANALCQQLLAAGGNCIVQRTSR